jgi:hypothetical protein
MKSAGSDNYEVGYRKPPMATRFRKGQSGNPRGRKRASENFLAIFKRHAIRRVRIKASDGTSKTLSVAEAIITKNYQEALKQDETAMANVLKLAELAGEFQDRTDPKVMGGYIFMPEKASLEELLEEMGSSIVKVGRQTDD